MIYRNFIKRLLDLILSLFICVFISPILIFSLAGILISSKGPLLFVQQRVGLNEKIFNIYKLRTMVVDHDRVTTQTTGKDPGVFIFGRFLRRYKIDELPQIFNVMIGDMSLIGPRPCLPITKDEMPQWAKERFKTRPGMTGLAQVNGNISISWEQRWEHDIKYVHDYSLLLDLKILIKTIAVVLFGEEKFRKQ